jgi:hypothetical protein
VLIATTAILVLLLPSTIHGDISESSQTTFSENKPLTEAIYTPQHDLIPTTTERLKLALSYYCRKYGTDYKKIDRIVFCESSWDTNAQNKNSTASGLGQFLNGTWKYFNEKRELNLDKNNPYDQLEMMTWIISQNGISHWNESKSCWN